MARKYSASEVIRIAAMKILAQYPQGLQFSTLKMYTEQELSNYIEPDSYNKGKYRSALWNLDKVKPKYVERTDSGGDKRFHPTQDLFNDYNSIELPDLNEFMRIQREKEGKRAIKLFKEAVAGYEDEFREYNFRRMAPWQKMTHIAHSLSDINDYITEKNLMSFLNRILEDPSDLTKEELEAVMRLKFCLEMLQLNYRSVFHDKF